MDKSGTIPRGTAWTGRFVPLAAVILAQLLVASEGTAQVPLVGDVRTAEGRVQDFTKAPNGDVDGAVLDDGTVIHWPPNLTNRFSSVADRGERIRVNGRMAVGPAGGTHLEVLTITNLRTSASVENNPEPPPPLPLPGTRTLSVPPPPGPIARPATIGPRMGEARTVESRVQSLTSTATGVVDGAVLDDGTVIHWPPHLADRFTVVFARGDRVKVSGSIEAGPAGDTNLAAQTATNLRTNASAVSDVRVAPPGRIVPDRSDDYGTLLGRTSEVERRLKELEDQVTQLREEVRRLRREP